MGLVHRLDRPVQGVMVFAKTSKAASRITKQIQNHDFHKQYLAIINGIIPEKKGEFCDYLEKKVMVIPLFLIVFMEKIYFKI